MSKTASQRAMADIDAVAEAICNAQYGGHPTWHMISEEARSATYRPMALAAIDALGLSEEWRTTGFLGPVSESFARSQAKVKGELQRRMVGQWTAEMSYGTLISTPARSYHQPGASTCYDAIPVGQSYA